MCILTPLSCSQATPLGNQTELALWSHSVCTIGLQLMASKSYITHHVICIPSNLIHTCTASIPFTLLSWLEYWYPHKWYLVWTIPSQAGTLCGQFQSYLCDNTSLKCHIGNHSTRGRTYNCVHTQRAFENHDQW